MGEVFIGSEAVAHSKLTEHELRRWHRSILRDVYVPRQRQPSLRDRTVGAWLLSRRRGVIAGVGASALHGARWVDDDSPVELIAPGARSHRGLIVRNEALADDEITQVADKSLIYLLLCEIDCLAKGGAGALSLSISLHLFRSAAGGCAMSSHRAQRRPHLRGRPSLPEGWR